MTFVVILVAVAVLTGWIQWRIGLARMAEALDRGAAPLRDPDLEALIARLGAAAGAPDLRAQLYDMPVVNGLATPDGRVFLTTALLDKYRLGALRAEEVASVVAHELGHLALGHHGRRMIDWTGHNAVRMILGVLLNRFLPVIGFVIAEAIARAAMARLSRRDEFEADRYATALMLKAGLGHAPQVSMFRKLERMVPGPRGAAWLASHPPVAERVAAIEANVAAWGAAAPG